MDGDAGSVGIIPLGDFLTAEEPVWVWDAAARRILWANQAGRAFWGASSNDMLRGRKFDTRNKAVLRMAVLANGTGEKREWVETLNLAAAAGRQGVTCHIQRLQVAGGHPGLIVKVLRVTGGPGRTSAGSKAPASSDAPPRPSGEQRAARADRTALDAIAARLKHGPSEEGGARREKTPVALNRDGPPDAASLTVRELCHELRNPLTVILGFAERIAAIAPAGRNQDKLQAYAADITESAHLAMAILGDFSVRILRPRGRPPRPRTGRHQGHGRELPPAHRAACQAGRAESFEKRGDGVAAAAGRGARPEANPAQCADERGAAPEDRRPDQGGGAPSQERRGPPDRRR